MKRKISILVILLLLVSGLSYAKDRQGIVTFKINLNAAKGSKNAKLWLPYPLSDEHQRIENLTIKGNFDNSSVYREQKSGAIYLFSEWQGVSDSKRLEMSFTVKAEERSVKDLRDTNDPVPEAVKKYLKSNRWIPTDGKIKELANKITKDKKGILEKSRAVYAWVVENTHRDPGVKGCGLGIVEQMLIKRGGKCVDISSIYIALARAAGVPAREVFGIRLGRKAEQDITGSYHCWAEFFLPGTGWIPVDPADVRKIMLAENLSLKEAKKYREYYFGAVDEFRITLEKSGRGLKLLPLQESGPLNYLMYPYAEIDGKPLDYLDPKSFSYTVTFKAI
ncbi:MAG TPA: transglutaminase domain-containing protein [Nitrospirae bacterium]|nr:transglutaminase domain-containing protein [Nitrospirota bacterium]